MKMKDEKLLKQVLHTVQMGQSGIRCVMDDAINPALKKEMKQQLQAYDAMEQEGFIITVHGKGSFVAGVSEMLSMEEKCKEVERDLEAAIRKGKSCGMSRQEIKALFEIILEE